MLIARIQNILLKPKEEWEKIKGETTSIAQVMTGYAIPLVLIPAVFGILGRSLIGVRFGFGPIGGTFRVPLGSSIVWAILYFILTLIGLYILGIVINALAPSFDSKQNSVRAFQLAVYSSTPAFVAGILLIIPALGLLVALVSLYGLVLFYLGIPILMETPREKLVGYFVVTIIVTAVIYFVVSAVSGAVMSLTWRPAL